MRAPSSRWAIAAFVALSMVGCDNNNHLDFKRAAQEELTKTFSCPKDRVVVTPRSDLKPFDLLVGARAAPPADVAADPGRLGVWKQQQQKVEGDYNRQSVLETRGCDQHIFYVCSIAEGSHQSQVVACRKAEHPPPN